MLATVTSRTVKKGELNEPIIEKELMAIHFKVKNEPYDKFKHIYDGPFEVLEV